MRIRFQSSPASIEIPDCPEFLAALRAAAIGWPFAEDTETAEPAVTVVRVGQRYEVRAPGADVLQASAVGAACALMVDVVEGCIEQTPARLWLHCGSVVINGRLLIFPSHSHAGKSTLVARLAAAGHTVFGDDILPLAADDASGIALGLAPRLRMPLPPRSSAEFMAFADRRQSASDGRYAFLELPSGGLAKRGDTAPLGAILLLDRRSDGPASLRSAPRAATLQILINQNFTPGALASRLLDRLHRVMDGLPCVTLRYSDLDDAAALIETTFRSWPVDLHRADVLDDARPPLVPLGEEQDLTVEADDGMAGFSPDARYARARGVHLRSVDGELFLAGDGDGVIYHLNVLGAGVWNLLEEPVAGSEIIDTVCGAFPDADRAGVERDVAALLTAMVSRGFASTLPGAQSSR